ncbi:D-alanine--D-alanine ligase [Clostridium sp. DL1XJH146]
MNVGVIMGGDSSEREVSLLTGAEIIKNLDKEKYTVVPVSINTRYELIDQIRNLEFAFIALHGAFGEDGKIQSLLETMDVPYSGCGVLSSALCMNKNMSKKIFNNEKIKTPNWFIIKKEDTLNLDAIYKLKFPLFIKPNNGGSSIGVYKVNNEEELNQCLSSSFQYDDEILVEEFIEGDEITCSILNGEVLPMLGITPHSAFFDYSSKYGNNKADEKVIKLSSDIESKVKDICLKCWDSFNLQVYARIDLIINKKGIYVLEIDTLPGMTRNSLLPKSAKAYGLNFTTLLDKIISSSLTLKRK